jgi:endonuclease/exonuclease/phosphatase family metal-dependent hydrolase
MENKNGGILMKRFLKTLLILILVVVLAVGGLLGWLSFTEYKPVDVESLEKSIKADAKQYLAEDATLDILTWNIGYAGLGAGSDFIMDGGKNVRSADETTVRQYLAGIDTVTRGGGYDLILLQEVDTDSARTYGINEAETLAYGTAYFALNFSCPWVPNPKTLVLDPIGKVNSGLLTISQYAVSGAERRALPCPFTWPLRIANLKRCLLVTYLPIEGSTKQLVLVNLHLEAYDDGEGKIQQTKVLRDFIEAEYKKGNYVIAGGDFNQVFPGGLEDDAYPNRHPALWTPGILDDSMLPGSDQPELPAGLRWKYAFDLSTPSCRLLNQPFDPTDTINTQYYVIDGFILSPNVGVELVETLDLGFANSDHNPVHLRVRLIQDP